jgi:multidrug efflux pump subunit AcrA (membrane-fusion protein)
MDAVPVPGEVLAVPERVIVAPAVGVFRPLAVDSDLDLTDTGTALLGDTPTPPGTVVTAGQAIGVIEGPGSSTPVRSPFGGFLIGMLARAGERVREGQPVAWLRLA